MKLWQKILAVGGLLLIVTGLYIEFNQSNEEPEQEEDGKVYVART